MTNKEIIDFVDHVLDLTADGLTREYQIMFGVSPAGGTRRWVLGEILAHKWIESLQPPIDPRTLLPSNVQRHINDGETSQG